MSRHPHAVPVITIMVLAILTLAAYGAFWHFNKSAPPKPDTRIVIISHDHQQQIVPSREATVGVLLQKLNLKLNPGDVVEPSISTAVDQDQFRINIYRAVPVEIVDGAQKTYTFSAATTPRSIAKQVGKTTYSEDVVTASPAQDFVRSGSIGKQVMIDRSTPVNVSLYGTPVVLRTQATTVRGMLAEKHIKLLPQDQVKPGLDVALATAGGISVVRNGLSTITQQEDIPAPVQTVPDNTLSYGIMAVRQQGSPGKRAVTYQVNTQNGTEVSRTVIQSAIIQQPVSQIVVQGSNLSGIKGDMALAGIAPGDYTYADYIISHESGWNPSAHNSSGTYGLCQALPGSKMASAGADWQTNPVTQLRWCAGYAKRYGGWAGSYNHWVAHHNW